MFSGAIQKCDELCRVIELSSRTAAVKTLVWRVDIGVGGRRRHQRHVVEGRHQDAAVEGEEVEVGVQRRVLVRGDRLTAVARVRRLGTGIGAAAELRHVPGRVRLGRFLRPRRRKRSPSEPCARELLPSVPRQRGAHGCERERVAGERAANAPDVGHYVGHVRLDHRGAEPAVKP